MAIPLATVGILSVGEMGLGIGKLLVAHGYKVVTNIDGRSEDTRTRALEGKIELLSNDIDLVQACDYILSIVPPRDALSTAQRIASAITTSPPRRNPLYFLDLNAVSPRSARTIAALFSVPGTSPTVIALDGGIIGGPPRPSTSTQPTNTVSTLNANSATNETLWTRPRISNSGPNKLTDAPVSGSHLAATLNVSHISPEIGSASGLKMCFASLTKGFTALAIQSFTTAGELGVLEELKSAMKEVIPNQLTSAERGVVGMAPKAYRWVKEMEEIAATHHEEGGFELGVFEGIAGVYRSVADETVLGQEKTERRKRGRTVEDVALAMGEGLKRSKRE